MDQNMEDHGKPKMAIRRGKRNATDIGRKRDRSSFFKCTNQGKIAVVQREPIVALVYQGRAS
jgi:hypothetical protein